MLEISFFLLYHNQHKFDIVSSIFDNHIIQYGIIRNSVIHCMNMSSYI